MLEPTELAEILHYLTIALTVSVTAVSVGIGQGFIGKSALRASDDQPAARSDIFKAAIFGSALSETSAIIGLTLSLFLLMDSPDDHSLYMSIAELGIACAICLPGGVIGFASAWPAVEACHAIARQPFFQQKIIRLMLLTQSIIQTPIIFGFIIAMFIKNQAFLSTAAIDSTRLAMSGLCIGLGSIGPALGLAFFARSACRAVGVNRTTYTNLVSFTLISEAIVETPIVFALVIALFLVSMSTAGWDPTIGIMNLIGSALCMGFGTLGPGISSGKTAAIACEKIAEAPDHYASIARLSMLAQGIIDTSAIYAFTIAMLLIFSH